MTREELIEKALIWLSGHLEDWEESVDYTNMAELMADFALSIQPPQVTEGEIRQEAWKRKAEEQSFTDGAKWMRNKLTPTVEKQPNPQYLHNGK